MKDLRFSSGDRKVSWFDEEGEVTLEFGCIVSSHYLPETGLIYVLAGRKKKEVLLRIFDTSGELLCEFQPPDGFTFWYVTTHPECTVAVACESREKIDGWHGWHFSIDIKEQTLTRICPAY